MPKKKSLIMKIAVFVVLTLFIINSFSAFIMYQQINKQIELQMNTAILGTLNGISANIDGDKLERLIKGDGKNDPYYKELNTYLNKCLGKIEVEYLYTVAEFQENKMSYIVDSLNEENEEFSDFGEELEVDEKSGSKYKPEYEALKTGYSMTPVEYFDEWGYILTGYVAIQNSKGENIALLAADFNASKYKKDLRHLGNLVCIILLISTIMIVSIISIYLNKIFKKLKSIEVAAVAIAGGNINHRIKVESNDEIGEIGKAFNNMINILSNIIKQINLQSEEVLECANKLSGEAELFSDTSRQVSTQAMENDKNTEIGDNSIKLIANSTHDMNEEMEEIVGKTQLTFDYVIKSYEDAHTGKQLINDSTEQIKVVNNSMGMSREKMHELEEKIDKISSSIEVINAITKQTNLLAINASIEATRAGKDGNGFVIVAHEVEQLAQQSTAVTKEIREILNVIIESANDVVDNIDYTYEETKKGVKVSKDAEDYLNRVLEKNNKIKENLVEVLKYIEGYSQKVHDIDKEIEVVKSQSGQFTEGSHNILSVVQKQSTCTEELLDDAAQLKEVSQKLQETIAILKHDKEKNID